MQASPLLDGFSLSPATLVMIPSSTVMLRPQPTPQKPQIVLACLRLTSVSIVVVTPVTPLPDIRNRLVRLVRLFRYSTHDLLVGGISTHTSSVVLVLSWKPWFFGLGSNPLIPGLHVEPALAQEAHEGHPELPGDVDGEAARGGDGANEGHARHQALLQDLEAAAPADHDDVIRERQPAFQERPPYELVRRVVPPHVFPQREKIPSCGEQRRRVQPTRRFEEPLRLPQLLRQGVDGLGQYLGPGRHDRAAAQF